MAKIEIFTLSQFHASLGDKRALHVRPPARPAHADFPLLKLTQLSYIDWRVTLQN
jgi:hypothetical protein